MAPVSDGLLVRTTIRATEIDQIDQATPYMHVAHQRIDGSDRPTVIDVAHHGVAERIDIRFGFSMAGEVTAADSSLTMSTPSTSPANGSVWDGLSPKPGQLWVYGPGSTQISFRAAGSGSHSVSVPWASLERAAWADRIDLPPWRAQRGRLSGPRARRLVEVLRVGFGELDHGSDEAEIVRSVLRTLTDPPSGRVAADRRTSSRQITLEVLDWLEAEGRWFPSLAEVCAAVWVSERRLRNAFVDVFQVPPGRFLRLRALNAARAELLDPALLHRSVTEVATDHGFRHLSLFAKHYRRTFGETPTATRRRSFGSCRSARNALGVA